MDPGDCFFFCCSQGDRFDCQCFCWRYTAYTYIYIFFVLLSFVVQLELSILETGISGVRRLCNHKHTRTTHCIIWSTGTFGEVLVVLVAHCNGWSGGVVVVQSQYLRKKLAVRTCATVQSGLECKADTTWMNMVEPMDPWTPGPSRWLGCLCNDFCQRCGKSLEWQCSARYT